MDLANFSEASKAILMYWKHLNGRKLRETVCVCVSVCLYTYIHMCQIPKAVIKLHVLPFQILYEAHICNSDIVGNLAISIQTTVSQYSLL